jgi:hypothetical protein
MHQAAALPGPEPAGVDRPAVGAATGPEAEEEAMVLSAESELVEAAPPAGREVGKLPVLPAEGSEGMSGALGPAVPPASRVHPELSAGLRGCPTLLPGRRPCSHRSQLPPTLPPASSPALCPVPERMWGATGPAESERTRRNPGGLRLNPQPPVRRRLPWGVVRPARWAGAGSPVDPVEAGRTECSLPRHRFGWNHSRTGAGSGPGRPHPRSTLRIPLPTGGHL